MHNVQLFRRKWIERKGFTLVELIMALMILASFVMIASRMRFGNHKRIEKAYQYHRAVQLLEKKMTELELEWSQEKLSSPPEDGSGTFEEEENFSWSFKTRPLELPKAAQLAKLVGSADDASITIAKMTTGVLSELVWEVKLTVHYKMAKSKSDYSLTSYFVDYSKDLQISRPTEGHP